MEVARTVPRMFIEEMNEQLTKEFQNEEVIQVIRQMHPTKAPSPNSMSAIFYKKILGYSWGRCYQYNVKYSQLKFLPSKTKSNKYCPYLQKK